MGSTNRESTGNEIQKSLMSQGIKNFIQQLNMENAKLLEKNDELITNKKVKKL